MDYELVIDLTDASTQAYMTSIQSLFSSIIPEFNVHDRNKYFTSIQLKCNLNTISLPDPKLLPILQDLNDSKLETLGGSLLKFGNIKRPSITQLLKTQKQKNDMHKKRINIINKSPNSSPSYSSTSSSNSSTSSTSSSSSNPNLNIQNNLSSKVKNRTFISNNKIIKTNNNNNNNNNNDKNDNAEIKQALQSSLPSPKHPNNNHNLNNNNTNWKQEEKQSSPPPPTYDEVIYKYRDYGQVTTTQQQDQKHLLISNHINDDDDDDTDVKLQQEKDAKVAQQLQEKLYCQPSIENNSKPTAAMINNNNNNNVNGFGLSDEEWKLQHQLLPSADTNDHHNEEDDYAYALKLQEAQQNEDEDMKIAMQLQKEEELRIETERRRNRYRNPNFIDYGSQSGDYIPPSFDSNSYARRHARINHTYYPQPNISTNSAGNHSNTWNPSIDDIILNNGSVPAVFRRILQDDQDDDDVTGDDTDEILAAALGHGLHSHHRRRRRRIDDSWQRLPVRTLNGKDIAILSKSEEKKSCPICMADFKIDDVTRQLPCFHEFHKDCVDKWFHQQNDKGKDASCPLDRKKIKDTANQHV